MLVPLSHELAPKIGIGIGIADRLCRIRFEETPRRRSRASTKTSSELTILRKPHHQLRNAIVEIVPVDLPGMEGLAVG
jgi:hypothetical protein